MIVAIYPRVIYIVFLQLVRREKGSMMALRALLLIKVYTYRLTQCSTSHKSGGFHLTADEWNEDGAHIANFNIKTSHKYKITNDLLLLLSTIVTKISFRKQPNFMRCRVSTLYSLLFVFICLLRPLLLLQYRLTPFAAATRPHTRFSQTCQ